MLSPDRPTNGRTSSRLSFLLGGLVLFLSLAAPTARAENVAPERYLDFPAMELAAGTAPVSIPLANHLRDPDVPGTAVRITVLLAGNTRTIDLALFDAQTPATVANFLNYVASGRYTANFLHRSVPGFIIQNGGFYFINDTTFDYVPAFDPVVNEPGLSNLRGTVAMAKLGGDPDSATSQWFINLADNSANLDFQNGGFTVFARVLGDGMTVADEIAAVPTYNASSLASAWTDLPLTTGVLNRANFIETSAAVIPALSTTVQSSAPDTVSASITDGVLTITPSASRSGSATLTLTTTDLEGGQLVSTFDVITVPGTSQTITFDPPADRTYGDAAFTPAATASSGLPVSFSVVSGPASIDPAGEVTLTGAGTVTLRAEQTGDGVYLPAPPVERSFTVSRAAASLTLGALTQTYTGTPVTPTAITSAGPLEVVFTYDGSPIPPTTPGTYVVAATINADNYTGFATGTLTIDKAPQSITFEAPADQTYGDIEFTPTATASSGLNVTFEIVSGPATLDPEGKLTATGVGAVTVRASQAGDLNHLPAPSVERTFTITATSDASLTLGDLAQTYDGTARTPSVITEPPGLAVTFSYGPSPGGSTPPVLPGSYAVTATLDDPRALNHPIASATLVIAPAPLTARAPNPIRAVSRPNPVLAVSYEGFVGNDTPATLASVPKLATKATTASAPGVYPITITGGASPLYTITLIPGTLTVAGYGGTYEALLVDADARPSGKITVTVGAKNLAFTGTLYLAGEAKFIGLKGNLTPSSDFSSASSTLLRTVAGTAYDLAFTVSSTGAFIGGLDRDAVPLADLAYGARSTPPAKGQTAPGAGANTLSLLPAHVLNENASAPLPGGAGYATAPIAASTGTLTLKGKTADGSPLTASLPPLAQNTYLLWANPYGTRTASFLSGPLALITHPEQNRFPGRLFLAAGSGLLTWQKAALPDTTPAAKRDKSHRAGFGPLGVPAAFDPWLPPSTKSNPATLAQRLGLAATSTASGTVSVLHGPDSLDFGTSGPALPFEATLDPKGAFVATGASATSWSLKITPTTGAFTGSFTLRDIIPPATKPTSRKVAFSGILRQPPADETGARLGTGQFLVPGFAKTDEQPSGELRLVAP